MALTARIQTLQQKHQKLDEEILELLKSPSTQNEKIAELKRQKLHVKDAIEQLEREGSLH